ncbi:DUF1131 family protein, partial [Escherichia coli]
CVTWELILDGYSESSYSATPRFAAARLPWFSGEWSGPEGLMPSDDTLKNWKVSKIIWRR